MKTNKTKIGIDLGTSNLLVHVEGEGRRLQGVDEVGKGRRIGSSDETNPQRSSDE